MQLLMQKLSIENQVDCVPFIINNRLALSGTRPPKILFDAFQQAMDSKE